MDHRVGPGPCCSASASSGRGTAGRSTEWLNLSLNAALPVERPERAHRRPSAARPPRTGRRRRPRSSARRSRPRTRSGVDGQRVDRLLRQAEVDLHDRVRVVQPRRQVGRPTAPLARLVRSSLGRLGLRPRAGAVGEAAPVLVSTASSGTTTSSARTPDASARRMVSSPQLIPNGKPADPLSTVRLPWPAISVVRERVPVAVRAAGRDRARRR